MTRTLELCAIIAHELICATVSVLAVPAAVVLWWAVMS
jgi:hypothetical protein